MSESTGTKAIKLIGEAVLPGASLVLDGDIKSGALHFVGGVVGRMVLGPIGWFYAAADSYSKSSTGKHFHEHFLSSSES